MMLVVKPARTLGRCKLAAVAWAPRDEMPIGKKNKEKNSRDMAALTVGNRGPGRRGRCRGGGLVHRARVRAAERAAEEVRANLR